MASATAEIPLTRMAFQQQQQQQQQPLRSSSSDGFQGILVHAGVWISIVAIAALAFPIGVELRHWAWYQTSSIRFQWDIQNAYDWGSRANRDGIVKTYNQLEEEHAKETEPAYMLDYSPLRLAVVAHWVKWTHEKFPGATGWRNDYAFNAMMLRLNMVAEIASAIGVFLLVQHWVRRSGRGAARAAMLGLSGALILWFNPAVIWDDHCWPQWDVWIVPFYVFAVLAASMEWWFTAGILIGLGAMVKGQILLAAPVLALWPLFQLRLGATMRFIGGSLLAIAIVGAPWLAASATARWWLASVFLATILLIIPVVVKQVRSWGKVLLWLVAAGLIAWPLKDHNRLVIIIGVLSIVVLLFVMQRLSAKSVAYAIGVPMAAAMLLCAPLFGAHLGWLELGLGYGARKFQVMGQVGTSNLATILNKFWNWQIHDAIMVPLPLPGVEPLALTTHDFLLAVYLVTLVLCGMGAAIQSRRNDARLLAAVTAPWVLFFALLTQMNNRYLFWGAVLGSALMAGVSWGMTLLGLVLSLCCLSMMADIMYRWHPGVNPTMEQFLHPQHPSVGWLVLLGAGIFLYMSLAPSRRREPPSRDLTARAGLKQ